MDSLFLRQGSQECLSYFEGRDARYIVYGLGESGVGPVPRAGVTSVCDGD